MLKEVDARGLLCPEPVVLVKKELDRLNRGKLRVLVSTQAARENVTRLAQSKGWQVEVSSEGDDIVLILSK